MFRLALKLIFTCLFTITLSSSSLSAVAKEEPTKRVILFVWDGLRPDSVTKKDTPILYDLMNRGIEFKDNHASYPTFTMMNAASFATGDFADKTGFFGNTFWSPKSKGVDSAGKKVDFEQPVYTEDYKILQDLAKNELLFVTTLFQAAHQQRHLKTASIGKSGPAFLQDYKSYDIILDEKHAYPLTFAKQLQKAGYALPKLSPLSYAHGALTLKADNEDPTKAGEIHKLADGITPDPTDESGSPYTKANQYMMNIFLTEILPKHKPDLAVVWMRDPDGAEHQFGPGSVNYFAALGNNDKMLGQLLAKLDEFGLRQTTDVIVVSDHAHSNVSGPFSEFPLRQIRDKKTGAIDKKGFSVSGNIRVADILTHAGFHAYDGGGCFYMPVLSGIKKDGAPLYPTKIDKDGSICGKAEEKYTTPAYKVPAKNDLPDDAVIIAANGGTDYLYVPSHNEQLIHKLVTFMQSHEQFGAIFVNNDYGFLNGTLPMSLVHLQNSKGRSPDIIVSLSYDAHAKMNGLFGTEFSDHNTNMRGMHGTFSLMDVHNFLAAEGPDFRKKHQDFLPTGNVDLAPTIASILHLQLPETNGRILREALNGGSEKEYKVKRMIITPKLPAIGLTIFNTVNQKVHKHYYSIQLQVKLLKGQEDGNYAYFDYAKAQRR